MFVELQIKNNPFVKTTPNHKNFHLLEKKDNLIRIRMQTLTTGIPAADCFYIDEEMVIQMPQGCYNSCVLRLTMVVVWKKYTVLKSTIMSGSIKNSKELW